MTLTSHSTHTHPPRCGEILVGIYGTGCAFRMAPCAGGRPNLGPHANLEIMFLTEIGGRQFKHTLNQAWNMLDASVRAAYQLPRVAPISKEDAATAPTANWQFRGEPEKRAVMIIGRGQRSQEIYWFHQVGAVQTRNPCAPSAQRGERHAPQPSVPAGTTYTASACVNAET